MSYYNMSRFFCTKCGNEGIPIQRKRGQFRGKFHKKKLYCLHCQTQVNHVECRNEEEIEEFKRDFKEGKYLNEDGLDDVGATWVGENNLCAKAG